MKIFKWLLIVVGILALIVLAFLSYLGLFSELKTYEAVMGPYTIAYESFTGPYAQTGPVFDRVYKAVKAAGIETTRGLGLYYDDPSKVEAAKLRSELGVIIEAKDLAKFKVISQKFKVKVIPKKPSIVAEFPIRNMLSYMIGPMKGYPALVKYAGQKGCKLGQPYELYDEAQKKIFFVIEIK
jgi:hypothetical protein